MTAPNRRIRRHLNRADRAQARAGQTLDRYDEHGQTWASAPASAGLVANLTFLAFAAMVAVGVWLVLP